jgi:hypothetical protein
LCVDLFLPQYVLFMLCVVQDLKALGKQVVHPDDDENEFGCLDNLIRIELDRLLRDKVKNDKKAARASGEATASESGSGAATAVKSSGGSRARR